MNKTLSMFEAVPFDKHATAASRDCRAAFENVEDILVKNFTKNSAELELAMQKLEEAYMWVNRELRRQQIERNINFDKVLGEEIL